MTHSPEISIIVPVYRVEQYLNDCIDSILAQTFTDFEVILVDDGSPDSCPALCDAAAAKDSRIRVIHKPNGGVGEARNVGIEAAQGEYLTPEHLAQYGAQLDIWLCGPAGLGKAMRQAQQRGWRIHQEAFQMR